MANKIRTSRAAAKKKAHAVASLAKDRRIVLVAAAILVLATAAAYLNSLNGPFIYDDDHSILDNRSIQHLGEIGKVLTPPGGGVTVSGRPVLNLSLAFNYALSGTEVRGYHITNLAIHILAGLLLFGIARRTLLLPSMRGAMLPSEAFRANAELPRHGSVPSDARRGEDGSMAPFLAGAIALLWMVHPLQTESVTYIVQRAESLMGLFYLLLLYCVIRSSASRGGLWSLAAVAACAMGMATKEVTATAPLIVLLYDRTFLAGSFGQALRKRWGLYAGLAACWGLLAILMASEAGRAGTAGFGGQKMMGCWAYTRTQFGIILHYVRLAFWPDSLCLDYGPWVARTVWEIVPQAIVVAAMAAATIWGLRRGRKWGFLGAWFLVILAPTSSFVPVRDAVVEHRMYLPLAAVASMAVLAVFLLWRKLLPRITRLADESGARQWAGPCLALAVAAGALGARTALRNMDYHSAVAIWQSAVDRYPFNPRAHLNLGFALNDRKDYDLAIEEYRQAVRFDPDFVEAHYNLGSALNNRGQYQEAVEQLQCAIRLLKPESAEVYNCLGLTLFHQGKLDLAIEQYRHAIGLNPRFAQSYGYLGAALGEQGKLDEAIECFRQAIREDPKFLLAYQNLALALRKSRRDQEASEVERQAAELELAPPSR